MTTISLRVSDELIDEVNRHADALHLTRTEYIRRAIDAMNREVDRQERRRRIINASQRVRAESMRVNEEFSAIEDNLNA